MLFLTSAAPLALSLLLISSPAVAGPSPQQTATRYCELINNGAIDTQYDTVMSAALSQKLGEVIRQDVAFRRKYPDLKPPMGDGIPFTGSPDSASGHCKAGKLTRRGAERFIDVEHLSPGVATDRNRLVLVRDGGDWKVDDIRYGAGGHFRSFRQRLDALSGQGAKKAQ